MGMLDIVHSFVPHYTRWDVLRYIDFQEEKTMNRTHLSVRMLCEAAVMVALAQILSYLKLMELPNGGSLTPAMFPIILFAVRWGTAPGLMAGFVFGLLQLIFDGAYAWGWQSMLLDYLAAGHRDQMETVRVRLMEYFAIPDPSDERLKRARRRLATLMY